VPPKQAFSETVFINLSLTGVGYTASGWRRVGKVREPPVGTFLELWTYELVTQAITRLTETMLMAVETKIAAETRCGATP
jgi:hypothetical protein